VTQQGSRPPIPRARYCKSPVNDANQLGVVLTPISTLACVDANPVIVVHVNNSGVQSIANHKIILPSTRAEVQKTATSNDLVFFFPPMGNSARDEKVPQTRRRPQSRDVVNIHIISQTSINGKSDIVDRHRVVDGL
jgi:hypothetical protein